MKSAIQTCSQSSVKLEGLLELYTEKRRNLEFSVEIDFPDRWQMLLEASYGMLFEPFIATTVYDSFATAEVPKLILQGTSGLLQTSLLHPKLVRPNLVLELPFIYPSCMFNIQNYHTYSIGRLLAVALLSKELNFSQYMYEFDLLVDFVEDYHVEVYHALIERDNDRLECVRDEILSNSPTKFFDAWWEIFFMNHLD